MVDVTSRTCAMTAQGLSTAVRALLRRIETYEQLDVVLVMAHEPERVWTADALAERVRLPAGGLQEGLDSLSAQGLLSRAGEGWRLPDAQTQELACQLLEAYRENVLEVVRELTENAMERLRVNALRTFADAFVVRKDP
jgi:DNA-binding IclR family transcriptional regulator